MTSLAWTGLDYDVIRDIISLDSDIISDVTRVKGCLSGSSLCNPS